MKNHKLLFSFALTLVLLGVFMLTHPHTASAATITVNNADDNTTSDSNCTLREAIENINAQTDTHTDCTATGAYGSSDRINFTITGGGSTFVNLGQTGYEIQPNASSLPDISKPVIIDGYSQPNSQANNADAPNPLNGILLIEINGSSAGASANGINFRPGSDGSTVQGLIINDFASGDALSLLADNIQVKGNYIGTDPTGTSAHPNVVGVNTYFGDPNVAQNVTVGGLSASDRNLISGNTAGTTGTAGYPSTGWVIQGNYVGVKADGLTALPNSTNAGSGSFSVDHCSDVTIGGSQPTAINVIGASLGHGIAPDTVTNVTIEGNYIGLGYDGTTVLGNTTGGSNGSGIASSNANGITIKNNRIAGWKGDGIYTPSSNTNVTISNNYIHNNIQDGIDLGSSGTTIKGNSIKSNSGSGIWIFVASNNIIGGTTTTDRNIISGNTGYANIGIYGAIPFGGASTNNIIQGNYIGTNDSGQYDSSITQSAGIVVYGDSNQNQIGGSASGAGNVIAGNTGAGVLIAELTVPSPVNYTGTPTKNDVLGNKISNTQAGNVFGVSFPGLGLNNASFVLDINTLLPVSANESDATPNDPGDTDSGPNNYMNFPVVNSTTQNGTAVTVNFNLHANDADTTSNTYRVEFFANDVAGVQGYGEGKTYLGAATSVANGDNQTATITVPNGTDLTGKYITATTTAINTGTSSGFGSTSEFSLASNNVTVIAPATSSTASELANTGQNVLVVISISGALIISGSFIFKKYVL